ncbi:nucleotide exchange factor GrpE [Saccharopolyspora spinosa]|uniref:Molecular chaperone GrpE (Heat shock protein) n=1 Tax=Saccharopolyspora spinosa TaxID=60894 RepID=A0A2N3XVW8_SACSN|nr:nucleotide exchange factor GrpE [Saccharopolyspora spinosa]PKW14751.1 molecular chaperone GrpE (heat shock protein) [Saccharopolyspora spinosa]
MRDEPGHDERQPATGEPVDAAREPAVPAGEPAVESAGKPPGPARSENDQVEPAKGSAEAARKLVGPPENPAELGDDAADSAVEPETGEQPGESAEPLPDAPPDPVARLAEAVAALTEQVHEHHERAVARERVIDKLHADVERLRAGEQNLVLRPITKDLQNLRKDLLHQAGLLPAEIGRQQVVDLLESFALSAEQALERCGSAPIRPEIGAEFAPREHRAIKVLPADDPAQHERIAVVVSDGYLDTTTDRVTVPARVHVYRWSAESAPATENDPRAEGMSADV